MGSLWETRFLSAAIRHLLYFPRCRRALGTFGHRVADVHGLGDGFGLEEASPGRRIPREGILPGRAGGGHRRVARGQREGGQRAAGHGRSIPSPL